MSPQIGQVFAGYTILRVLGAGGMGTVYLAAHPRLPREDALKVLPAELTNDAEYRARFIREADQAAGLSHPHIVGIQDRGEYDGQLWIAMDYVPGTDLDRLLTEHRMGLDELTPVVTAVAAALDYAHHRGLLHRDVKPANILLTEPDGAQPRRVYLADFGIARRIDDPAGLTETNMAVGTVSYAAPEQLKGDPVDGRVDQYALACTAFHALTGEPPYPDTNPTVVVTQHVFAPPPVISVRRPDLAGLDLVFTKAMAKEPGSRYASCGDFAALFSRYSRGELPAASVAAYTATAPALPVAAPARRRPRVLIGALMGAALLIAAGVFVGLRLVRENPAPAAKPPAVSPVPTPTTTVPPTPGPLNGTYRADFAGATDLDGHGKGPAPTTGSYGLRSICRGAICVATATKLSGDDVFAAHLVFDETENRWTAISFGSEQCRGAASEYWQVLVLQSDPEGVLTGEFTATSANTCRYKRAVTFTRTGDVDVNAVADPATLPPRVASPAEALHGRYRVDRTYPTGTTSQPAEQTVTTRCVRTGERCMSYLHGPTSDVPLVFADGSWAQNEEADYICPAGGTLHFSVTARFPLPQPAQDPIPLLSGNGHQEQTGACAVNTDFTQTFTRTGD